MDVQFTWTRGDTHGDTIPSLKISNICVYADLERYSSPSIITVDDLRPEIVVIKGNFLYTLALTVGFETNISKNAERKKQKYAGLIENLQRSHEHNK